MADNVKVAVRVRPFISFLLRNELMSELQVVPKYWNSREINLKSTLCIEMKGNATHIKNPEDSKAAPKKFTFDYSYWSHDGYKEGKDGYLAPKGDKYADQKKVFSDLGQGVLDNAWLGYNCSLFAYGQTGSGKSYSMVGYGANKGIVPIVCDELFKTVAEKQKEKTGTEYQVMFSMLEIYNEQVRNLLDPASFKIKGGLKIRQHPQKGFFVDGVKPMPVSSFQAIENLMEKGTKNRTVASTNMNATSSRAHTIVAINFVQNTKTSGKNMTKTSVINLVDLAGSERAQSTGATGDRLKEGAAINLSLTMLGNVIKALADNKKGVKVPFRDSKLTMLLQNALSGNSKTVMIAALSPATVNYEETLSTLRFADRAKAIKTKAVVNESPTDKLIRDLKEENKRLQELVKKGGSGGAGVDEAELNEMKELLRKNQEEMDGMQQSWQQKLKEKEAELESMLKEERQKVEQQKTVPHLWNLHEDQALTAKVLHFVPPGVHRVGNRKADPPPDIMMSGLGIQDEHAVIENKKGKVYITPKGTAKIFLNGNEISEKKEMHHHDRVMFGSNNLYVFHHPKDYAASQKKGAPPEEAPTYEAAQDEIAEMSGLKEALGVTEDKSDLILQEDLVQMWPMVSEANAMSEEMDKKVKFEMALISAQARGKKDGRTEVCVKLKDLPSGNEFVWDRNQFINRKYLMQEMYQNFIEGESIDVPKEQDPFWEDPNTEVMIGCVHVYMWSLAHVVELEEKLQVTDYRGQENGLLDVAIFPCTKAGKELGVENDAFVEDPTEMIGKELHFKVKINNIRGLPRRFEKSCCKFKFYLDNDYTATKEIAGTSNPDFKFDKKFSYSPVTTQFLTYLQKNSLIIEVWGRQKPGTKTQGLNTKELMNRDKGAIVQGGSHKQEEDDEAAENQSKLMIESNTYKKRMERAELKLRKIQELIEASHKSGSNTLKVLDVEHILKAGNRMRAVARVVAEMEKNKKDSMGAETSQACMIQ